MLKGYFLISFSVLLLINRCDLLPKLCGTLSLLAICILSVYLVLEMVPSLRTPVYLFGNQTGMLALDERDYGDDLVMKQVYFVTSPMLAISIAYYFAKAKDASKLMARMGYWLLFTLNTVGMYLAGTRNNILISILLPTFLWFLYTRHKILGIVLFMGCLPFFAMAIAGIASTFFNPAEQSNEIKLGLVSDYIKFFGDINTLLFGQGLGAYAYWEGRGSIHFISELTYFELIRNFGIFGALAFYLMLIYPIIRCFQSGSRFNKSMGMAFGAYLVICISNPNLFMSMGVLILSILLANIYMTDVNKKGSFCNVPGSGCAYV